MRMLVVVVALLTGCIDGVIEDDCDVYVDYLCTCGVENCAQLQSQFEDPDQALQETCRIALSCFEEADAEAGQTCVLFDEDNEDVCLES